MECDNCVWFQKVKFTPSHNSLQKQPFWIHSFCDVTIQSTTVFNKAQYRRGIWSRNIAHISIKGTITKPAYKEGLINKKQTPQLGTHLSLSGTMVQSDGTGKTRGGVIDIKRMDCSDTQDCAVSACGGQELKLRVFALIGEAHDRLTDGEPSGLELMGSSAGSSNSAVSWMHPAGSVLTSDCSGIPTGSSASNWRKESCGLISEDSIRPSTGAFTKSDGLWPTSSLVSWSSSVACVCETWAGDEWMLRMCCSQLAWSGWVEQRRAWPGCWGLQARFAVKGTVDGATSVEEADTLGLWEKREAAGRLGLLGVLNLDTRGEGWGKGTALFRTLGAPGVRNTTHYFL